MKTFENTAAQGDVYFRRVSSIPADAKRVEKWDGIVTHSERSHHHLFRKLDGVEYFQTQDPLVCYLRLASDEMLEHARDWSTHETLLFSAGSCIEVRRQREGSREIYRPVVD